MRYVAGAGVVNCDILYSGITRLPSEGEEIFSTGFDLQLGGGIPGIMVNLARLGVPVKFSTYLGNDFFSQFVKINWNSSAYIMSTCIAEQVCR